MNLQDEVVAVIEDEGPVSSEMVQQETGWPRKKVENAIFRALRRGDIRMSGYAPRPPGKGGQATALYVLVQKGESAAAPAKFVNSVWQLGSRT